MSAVWSDFLVVAFFFFAIFDRGQVGVRKGKGRMSFKKEAKKKRTEFNAQEPIF